MRDRPFNPTWKNIGIPQNVMAMKYTSKNAPKICTVE